MSEWFLEPARLWLLVVVVGLIAIYVALQFTRPRYAVRFSNLELLDKVAPRRPGWRRHLVAGTFLVATSLLVVSFAQPVMSVRVPQERTTIMLAFDVSLSMAAEDIQPSRFIAAKEAATDFVEQLPDELNLGFVSFAGTARLLVPPTTDRQAVVSAIANLELDKATAIGDAVKLSLDVIEDQAPGADGERPDAAIVLLSDGETTVGMSTEEATALAAEAGVPVSTIAYGTAGGQIMVDEDGDGIGQLTAVPVNVEELARLAEGTGGLTFTAESAADIDRVYDELSSTIGYEEEPQDVSYRFVGAGLLLMVLAAGLSLRWFGRLV